MVAGWREEAGQASGQGWSGKATEDQHRVDGKGGDMRNRLCLLLHVIRIGCTGYLSLILAPLGAPESLGVWDHQHIRNHGSLK